MFTMDDLEVYFDIATMNINDIECTLTKVEELSGVLALWMSESYKVYATPYFDGVAVPVHVNDCNNQEIGLDSYPVEVECFERYCKIVQMLAAKIIRRPRM
jgi:formylmethanofuran dehydrogenase subunit A